MKKLFQHKLSILGILFLLLTSPIIRFALEDAIIAVVNDVLITLHDLRNYVRQTYVSMVTQGRSEEELTAIMKELEQNGLNKLIEDKIILSEANKIGMEINPKVINERVDEIKQRYGGEQAFIDSLVTHNANPKELKDKIHEQLKIKFTIEREVKDKIFVNPNEVTDYYEQHKGDFHTKEKVNVDSIFIAFTTDEEKGEAYVQMTDAYNRIKNGENFRKVAEEVSANPPVGVIERGQLLKTIEDVVFNLELNEVSPIVEVNTGYYLFQLKGKSLPKIASLDEVKDQISNLIFRDKFRTQFQEWLNKLKEEAHIEIKE